LTLAVERKAKRSSGRGGKENTQTSTGHIQSGGKNIQKRKNATETAKRGPKKKITMVGAVVLSSLEKGKKEPQGVEGGRTLRAPIK